LKTKAWSLWKERSPICEYYSNCLMQRNSAWFANNSSSKWRWK
jgi:hypothetical protein